jgi:hydrogenase nickel incorporation protein HypB
MCDSCGCGEAEHPHRHEEHGKHLLGQQSRLGLSGNVRSHSPDNRVLDLAKNHRSVQVELDVTVKNDHLASYNRGWFKDRGIFALNLVSSPGAGKTTLLERTLRDLAVECPWAVIEGDQQTDNDARRIAACGVPVIQVNTGAMCHLDAQMVLDACHRLKAPPGAVIVIENVGNLICPAMFDLGEAEKIVIASVAEGDDKPEKYPHIFEVASLVILNKCDLLPYVPFDVRRFDDAMRRVNPDVRVLKLSAIRGDNLDTWYDWLRERRRARSKAETVQRTELSHG